jgi:hypothetical protein
MTVIVKRMLAAVAKILNPHQQFQVDAGGWSSESD